MYLLGNLLGKGSNFHRTFITLTLHAYRYFAFLGFLFPDDKHVGDTLELIVTDLTPDLLVAVVDLRTDILSVERSGYLVSVVVELLTDRQPDDLGRRETAGEVH